MKASPSSISIPMSLYHVVIGQDGFDTLASSPQAAISKCAYRYALRHGDPVALVQWNIRQGKLTADATIDEGRGK